MANKAICVHNDETANFLLYACKWLSPQSLKVDSAWMPLAQKAACKRSDRREKQSTIFKSNLDHPRMLKTIVDPWTPNNCVWQEFQNGDDRALHPSKSSQS